VLGLGGSSSLIMRRTSPYAASFSRLCVSGVLPVSSSYNSTPSEKMSVRVSAPSALISACSGLMYSGVPTIVPYCVNTVRSVSRCSVAFATPKSITLGTGFPS
jgi:hypothetical protein